MILIVTLVAVIIVDNMKFAFDDAGGSRRARRLRLIAPHFAIEPPQPETNHGGEYRDNTAQYHECDKSQDDGQTDCQRANDDHEDVRNRIAC